MSFKKLKDVHLFHSMRVDTQDNLWKTPNYDIQLIDDFFIKVTHKVSGKSRMTTVHNMISCELLPETKSPEKEATMAPKKRIVKPEPKAS